MAGSVITIFLYDLQGNIIYEMRNNGTYDDYLYLENQRIAKIANSGATYYYHNDHLGTPIAMTDQNRAVVWKAAYKTLTFWDLWGTSISFYGLPIKSSHQKNLHRHTC